MPAFNDPKRRQSIMPDDLRQVGNELEGLTGPLAIVAGGGILVTPASSMAEELRQRMAGVMGTEPVVSPPPPLPPTQFWPAYQDWRNYKDDTRRLREALASQAQRR